MEEIPVSVGDLLHMLLLASDAANGTLPWVGRVHSRGSAPVLGQSYQSSPLPGATIAN